MSHSDDSADDNVQLLHYKLFEQESEIHLIPAEDTLDHTPEKTCICCPLWDDEIQALADAEYINKTIYLHQDAYLRPVH